MQLWAPRTKVGKDITNRYTSESLRVAVVTETYPPEVNGVARTIHKAVTGLIEAGHQIQLVRPQQSRLHTPVCDPKVEVECVPGCSIPGYRELRIGLPSQNRLLRLWMEKHPDIVHIVTEGPLGWSALQAAQKLEIPTVSEFRTNFHQYSRHYGVGFLNRPVLRYLRWFHNSTLMTMVPTRGLAAELKKEGFNNLRVVARGVDTERFHPAKRSVELRRMWGANEDTVVVLYVGRLAPEKNLGVVVDAFQAIRAEVENCRLVWVGDGPDRERLKKLSPSSAFAGFKEGEGLAQHYASGDMLLFPSLTETFGNVTPEALASGLPVVAYNHAAAGELVKPGWSGFLADPHDLGDFSNLAALLARNLNSVPEWRENARESVAELTWQNIIEELESVYYSCVDSIQQGQGQEVVSDSYVALNHCDF